MSLEAIEQISKAEAEQAARKLSAQIEAKNRTAEAERAGKEQIRKTQEQADARRAELLAQAEASAKRQSEQILHAAEEEARRLRDTAKTHLDETAEWIVGKVVGR